MLRNYVILFLACSSFTATGQEVKVSEVSRQLAKEIENGEIAGGVVVMGDVKGIITQACGGFADVATKRPMSENDLFWIASMTKPITATAIMKLQEEGKLKVHDPVEKYLPEFQKLRDAQGNHVVITIGQCLSHTSGLSDIPRDREAALTSLADLTQTVVTLPLQFPPGSKWQYCQSGINTAARVVEVVSQLSFTEFLQKNIFDPLEMKDTTFYPNASQQARLVTSYRQNNGNWQAVPLGILGGKPLSDQTRYPRANGGLFSTAKDYGHFAQMILGQGEWRHKRILSKESVAEMTAIHTADLTTGFTAGNGWGWGWCVVKQPQGVSASLSPGSFGHGGAFGTQCWIDPVKKRYFLLLVQRSDFPNSDGSGTRQRLQEAAWQQ